VNILPTHRIWCPWLFGIRLIPKPIACGFQDRSKLRW